MALTDDDREWARRTAERLSPFSEETRDQLALLLRPAVAAVRHARAQERRIARPKRAPGGAEATA